MTHIILQRRQGIALQGEECYLWQLDAQKQCGQALVRYHELECKAGGWIILRHNSLCDCWAVFALQQER